MFARQLRNLRPLVRATRGLATAAPAARVSAFNYVAAAGAAGAAAGALWLTNEKPALVSLCFLLSLLSILLVYSTVFIYARLWFWLQYRAQDARFIVCGAVHGTTGLLGVPFNWCASGVSLFFPTRDEE